MYTALHLNVRLREDTPEEVIEILRYMINEESKDSIPTPEHPLFATERWDYMLQCNSYYHNCWTGSEIIYDDIGRCYFLRVQCDFKNYDDEISKFVDWIAPYTEEHPGEWIGYHRYEEDAVPTMIFKPA